MSGLGTSSMAPPRSAFGTFSSRGFFGRKSVTAAAMITTSAPGATLATASCISSAVRTGTGVTSQGGPRCTGPLTNVTVAPRARAAAASAYPMRPDDRLDR